MTSLRLFLAGSLAGAMATSTACDGSKATPGSPTEAQPSMIEPDDSDTIPCGPRVVLQTICQQCHTRPPQNGAPFPLVRHADIVRETPDGPIYELMIAQMEVGRMPLSPVTIDYASRETLLDWLHAGAPAEPPHACEGDGGAQDAPTND